MVSISDNGEQNKQSSNIFLYNRNQEMIVCMKNICDEYSVIDHQIRYLMDSQNTKIMNSKSARCSRLPTLIFQMRTHVLLVLLSVHLVFTQRGETEFGGNGTGDEGDRRIINGDDADENEYPFMVSQCSD